MCLLGLSLFNYARSIIEMTNKEFDIWFNKLSDSEKLSLIAENCKTITNIFG